MKKHFLLDFRPREINYNSHNYGFFYGAALVSSLDFLIHEVTIGALLFILVTGIYGKYYHRKHPLKNENTN